MFCFILRNSQSHKRPKASFFTNKAFGGASRHGNCGCRLARSRLGSDSPPDCHSLPRRRSRLRRPLPVLNRPLRDQFNSSVAPPKEKTTAMRSFSLLGRVDKKDATLKMLKILILQGLSTFFAIFFEVFSNSSGVWSKPKS